MRFKAVMLDFDGVLVESNDIKDRAFEHVFAGFPEHVPEILEYHRRTSLVRFRKFQYIYEKILKRPYTPQVEQDLAARFSSYCVDKVIAAAPVKGSGEFLDYFYPRVPLYIVSINPAKDLEIILKGRGLDQWFKKVYAVEGSKARALREIVKDEGIRAQDAVFVGDAVSDYRSARKAGVHFVGRRSDLDLPLSDVKIFDDLHQVRSYLTET